MAVTFRVPHLGASPKYGVAHTISRSNDVDLHASAPGEVWAFGTIDAVDGSRVTLPVDTKVVFIGRESTAITMLVVEAEVLAFHRNATPKSDVVYAIAARGRDGVATRMNVESPADTRWFVDLPFDDGRFATGREVVFGERIGDNIQVFLIANSLEARVPKVVVPLEPFEFKGGGGDRIAIEDLKGFELNRASDAGVDAVAAFWAAMADKEFPAHVARSLAKTSTFGYLASQLVLRSEAVTNAAPILNFIAASTTPAASRAFTRYEGRKNESARIDAAIANRTHAKSTPFHGTGIADIFAPDFLSTDYIKLPSSALSLPVAIIGGGIAGLMTAVILGRIGFRNVTVYDKKDAAGGIWTQDNVRKGSRNNPRDLRFLNYSALGVAPGPGDSIKAFADALRRSVGRYVKGLVASVVPKPFAHELFNTGGTKLGTYPIVINAIGTGRPNDAKDESRMVATGALGIRWQQILTPEDARGKRFVFVGLGNSTAEMLAQLHKFQDSGVETDYVVLTHYPKDAIMDPFHNLVLGEKEFRVFRDTSVNLVDFQGDLPQARADYFRALRTNRIVTDVTAWHGTKTDVTVTRNAGGTLEKFTIPTVSQIFTLIGYGNDKEALKTYGIECHPNGDPRVDYDGEFYSGPVWNRTTLKGYFGLGAVLKSSWDPNAIVIPGMIHRIGDLAFGVAMRATEHALKAA